MDAMSLLLQVDWPLDEVWGSAIGFVTVMVMTVGAIGLMARSLAVGAMGAFLTFSYYAITTDIQLLETLMFPIVVLMIMGVSFKLWRSEVGGDQI